MIDLHVHVLPGVDDGPAEMAEAVEMCRIAAQEGSDTLIVTPHRRHPQWPNEDTRRLEELREQVERAVGGRPRLLLGAEVYVDGELLRELERAGDRGAPVLAGSRYLLLEFPLAAIGLPARALVHELVIDGWRPIVAHPERVPGWAEQPELLAGLADAGALLQVTARSILGGSGRVAQRCCRFLLDLGLVHFVASDGHDAGERSPALKTAFRTVNGGWGEEVAQRLFVGNPGAVIDDRPLPAGAEVS